MGKQDAILRWRKKKNLCPLCGTVQVGIEHICIEDYSKSDRTDMIISTQTESKSGGVSFDSISEPPTSMVVTVENIDVKDEVKIESIPVVTGKVIELHKIINKLMGVQTNG